MNNGSDHIIKTRMISLYESFSKSVEPKKKIMVQSRRNIKRGRRLFSLSFIFFEVFSFMG